MYLSFSFSSVECSLIMLLSFEILSFDILWKKAAAVKLSSGSYSVWTIISPLLLASTALIISSRVLVKFFSALSISSDISFISIAMPIISLVLSIKSDIVLLEVMPRSFIKKSMKRPRMSLPPMDIITASLSARSASNSPELMRSRSCCEVSPTTAEFTSLQPPASLSSASYWSWRRFA